MSEALANVAKHAGATRVRGHAAPQPGVWASGSATTAHGGATIAPGGGLAGLRDRVEALDGKLLLHSPDGGPTILYVELPLASSATGQPWSPAAVDSLATTSTWSPPAPPPPPSA